MSIVKEEINAGLTRDYFMTILRDTDLNVEIILSSRDYSARRGRGISDQDIIAAGV